MLSLSSIRTNVQVSFFLHFLLLNSYFRCKVKKFRENRLTLWLWFWLCNKCKCRRKLRKPIWREGHRRSPRISAWKEQRVSENDPNPALSLSTSKNTSAATTTSVQHQMLQPQIQGPATRTRGRKKRRLRPLQDVASASASAALSPRPFQDVGPILVPPYLQFSFMLLLIKYAVM